jgi:hypothetical protein
MGKIMGDPKIHDVKLNMIFKRVRRILKSDQ